MSSEMQPAEWRQDMIPWLCNYPNVCLCKGFSYICYHHLDLAGQLCFCSVCANIRTWEAIGDEARYSMYHVIGDEARYSMYHVIGDEARYRMYHVIGDEARYRM